MDGRRHLWVGVALWLVAATAAAGCTEEAEKIHLHRVPPPAGGAAKSISILQDGEETRVVAPVRDSVFSRKPSRDRWEGQTAVWPEGWKQTAASPLAGVRWTSDSFNFPSNQRFLTYDGRIWMLTYHQPSRQPKLLVSDDRGGSWSTVELPERHRRSSEASPTSEDGQLSRMGARVPVRLTARQGRLYLLDKNRVWRAEFDDEAPESLETWEEVGVSEIDVLGANTSTALPTVVRNYLPPSEKRNYELLTVFGDRLYVYRRHRDNDEWLLVSTLPTVDLELRAPSGTEMVYLLAPEALYRSADRGERWEKSTLTRTPGSNPRNRAVAFVRQPDAPDVAPPAILVGTRRGTIYRSSDGGTSWSEVRSGDADGRSITGLVAEPDSDRVWASTDGLGVLVSQDRGTSWRTSNSNLRGTRPLAIERGLNDELVLGTRPGLFRLTGAPEDGHWNRLHDRATSAIAVDREFSRVVSGTIGGSLVTDRGSGEPVVSNAVAVGEEAPLFQPRTAPVSIRRERAILDIEARPGTEELFAWSHERGVTVSPDGGLNWKRKRLNPALSSALQGSLIQNVLAGRDDNLYLASRQFDIRSPDQFWHSANDGETWRAVTSFPTTSTRQPVLLRRSASTSTDALFLARGDTLTRSTDGGESWKKISGPWESGTIRAYRVDSQGHTVVFNVPRASRVAFSKEPAVDRSAFESYTLVWPDGSVGPRSGIRQTLRIGQIHYLMLDGEVYAGTIPQGETQLPNAPAIIAMLAFTFLLAAGSFWYLRFQT